MAQRKTNATHEEWCFYLSTLIPLRSVISNKHNSNGSATCCWRSTKMPKDGYIDLNKEEKRWTACKLALRLQHKATRAATVSLRDCVIRCEATLSTIWKFKAHLEEMIMASYVPSHLHLKSFLKVKQPAEVACLLLDLSTQTRV